MDFDYFWRLFALLKNNKVSYETCNKDLLFGECNCSKHFTTVPSMPPDTVYLFPCKVKSQWIWNLLSVSLRFGPPGVYMQMMTAAEGSLGEACLSHSGWLVKHRLWSWGFKYHLYKHGWFCRCLTSLCWLFPHCYTEFAPLKQFLCSNTCIWVWMKWPNYNIWVLRM